MLGHCLFGTFKGFQAAGAGCLTTMSSGLKNALDVRRNRIMPGSLFWIGLEGTVDGRRVVFLAKAAPCRDHSNRDGFWAVAGAFYLDDIANRGFGGAVNSVERLFQSVVSQFWTESVRTIDFDNAAHSLLRSPVYTQATTSFERVKLADLLKIEVHHEWERYLSVSDLLLILDRDPRFASSLEGMILSDAPLRAADAVVGTDLLSGWMDELFGEIQRSNEEMKRELDETNYRLDEVSRTLNEGKSELKKAEALNEKLSGEVSEQITELKALHSSLAEKSTQVEEAEREIGRLSIENNKLSDALSKRSKLETELDESEARVRALQIDNQELLRNQKRSQSHHSTQVTSVSARAHKQNAPQSIKVIHNKSRKTSSGGRMVGVMSLGMTLLCATLLVVYLGVSHGLFSSHPPIASADRSKAEYRPEQSNPVRSRQETRSDTEVEPAAVRACTFDPSAGSLELCEQLSEDCLSLTSSEASLALLTKRYEAWTDLSEGDFDIALQRYRSFDFFIKNPIASGCSTFAFAPLHNAPSDWNRRFEDYKSAVSTSLEMETRERLNALDIAADCSDDDDKNFVDVDLNSLKQRYVEVASELSIDPALVTQIDESLTTCLEYQPPITGPNAEQIRLARNIQTLLNSKFDCQLKNDGDWGPTTHGALAKTGLCRGLASDYQTNPSTSELQECDTELNNSEPGSCAS